ncbi:curli-like amyloid fiber formation chaperone CsgH [Aureimonas sp. AU40]|nr:curli-like amyloid fiber formation chaperone CsgH [Aureimonas sp. AU40]
MAIASIVVEPGAGTVRLTGRALGLSNGHVEARMMIEKSGPSGRTSTTQGGEFELSVGQDAVVATVGLSLSPGDKLDVDLVLTNGEREISRSRLNVGS